MKVIVLGGYGFVGKNVVEELNKREYKVISLSRRNGLDLTKLDMVVDKIKKVSPDVIINCAAHVGSLHYVTEKAADVLDDNIRIIVNIYKAVKISSPSTVIINPISNCSYPGNTDIQSESEYWNGPVHPSVWAYGNSRRMLVVTSKCYNMQYGIKSINFIAPNAYGPGDYADPNRTHALNGMIIRMLEAKKKGAETFEIWGTGKPIREWIYVKDLARILANTAESQHAQIEPINIAQNKGYSIREIAEIIKEVVGYNGNLVFNTRYQDGDPVKILDDKLFRKEYPDFVFTDLKEGIKETVEYYKKELEVV